MFPKLSKNTLVLAPVVLLALFALVAAYYYYSEYQKTQKLLESPTAVAKEEVKTLVDKVGKLMVLPEKEQPTVATVSEKSKLKDQQFFAQAENGDKVLIYTQAKKAILYRPSTNRIINVAPVNIGPASQKQSPTQPQSIRVALYNGTSTVGLTTTIEKQLEEQVKGVEVVAKEDAKKDDYEKTVVINLTGKNTQAQQIAKLLGVTVSALPQGEQKPQADILVIVGKDNTE